MKKKAILFLMTKKGLQILSALLESKMIDQVGLVVIGSDKGQYDYYDEIKGICVKNGIAHCDRTDTYSSGQFEYAFAIGWRWMIRGFERLIVLHDSLLPRYRGFSPLVNALLNEEKQVGVTALWASEKYDEGDIVLQKSIEINYPIKINAAIERISAVYVAIVEELFTMLAKDMELPSIPQDNNLATYSLWRDEEDYRIDWICSSGTIRNQVDSLGHPYSGASCFMGKKKIRLFEVEPVEDLVLENRDCGKVVFMEEGKPSVVCGKGILRIHKAIYADTEESIFPLKKFRIRFT